MTEAEWVSSVTPEDMLAFLRHRGQLTGRKARLFAVGCCRAVWSSLFPPRPARHAVIVAERYADGEAGEVELAEAEQPTVAAMPFAARGVCCSDALLAAEVATHTGAARRAVQAELLRDLFGPSPFRPLQIEPAWRTPAVLTLANTIYDERRWGEMPILADALSEGGCTDAEVLGHCREKVHTRGCWVADVILGKA